LKIEQDFWKNYNMITQVEALWLSKMSKSIIHINYINETFFETQCDMKKQLKNIEKQFKKAIEKLTQHMLEEQALCAKFSDVNMRNFILAVIIRFIRKNQQQLRMKYEEKHTQLMLIVNDIHLVKEFYDLKPNFLQVLLFFHSIIIIVSDQNSLVF